MTCQKLFFGIIAFAAFALLLGLSNPTTAAECKNRGDLDVRYCDENGDLLADTPKDSKLARDVFTQVRFIQIKSPSLIVPALTPSPKVAEPPTMMLSGRGERKVESTTVIVVTVVEPGAPACTESEMVNVLPLPSESCRSR